MAGKEISQRESGKALTDKGALSDPFSAFRQEMDRLMDSFFGGLDLLSPGRKPDVFSPRIDVVDSDKEIKVSAELPGLDEKDIEVTLTTESLTIKGEKKEQKEEKGKDYYRSERSFGSFTRTIPLPMEIDAEKVTAAFKKGVLTVNLPKTKQALSETKKVTVKAE